MRQASVTASSVRSLPGERVWSSQTAHPPSASSAMPIVVANGFGPVRARDARKRVAGIDAERGAEARLERATGHVGCDAGCARACR